MMQQFTKPATTSRIQLQKPATGATQAEQQQQHSFNPMVTRRLTNESNHVLGYGSNTMLFNVKNKNQK